MALMVVILIILLIKWLLLLENLRLLSWFPVIVQCWPLCSSNLLSSLFSGLCFPLRFYSLGLEFSIPSPAEGWFAFSCLFEYHILRKAFLFAAISRGWLLAFSSMKITWQPVNWIESPSKEGFPKRGGKMNMWDFPKPKQEVWAGCRSLSQVP